MNSSCPNTSLLSGATLVFKVLPYLVQDFLYGGVIPYVLYVSDSDILGTGKYFNLLLIHVEHEEDFCLFIHKKEYHDVKTSLWELNMESHRKKFEQQQTNTTDNLNNIPQCKLPKSEESKYIVLMINSNHNSNSEQ